MNRIALNVGRLVEIRTTAGYRSSAEVDAIFVQVGREIAKVPVAQRVVVVSDWRHCPVMSSDACKTMVEHLTRSNTRVERSAGITSLDSPVAVLQFVRLLRESKHPDRRMFHDAEELIAWLSEVLSPPERARVRAFLLSNEVDPKQATR